MCIMFMGILIISLFLRLNIIMMVKSSVISVMGEIMGINLFWYYFFFLVCISSIWFNKFVRKGMFK